jgi:uncharacterized protein YodC (DUF2158 family)
VTLQIGDVVRLKSGGPAMTVIATGPRAEPGVVECAWFDRDHTYARTSFPPRALEPVTLPQACGRPSVVAPGTGVAAG